MNVWTLLKRLFIQFRQCSIQNYSGIPGTAYTIIWHVQSLERMIMLTNLSIFNHSGYGGLQVMQNFAKNIIQTEVMLQIKLIKTLQHVFVIHITVDSHLILNKVFK